MNDRHEHGPIFDPSSLEISTQAFKDYAESALGYVRKHVIGTPDCQPQVMVVGREPVEGGQLGDIGMFFFIIDGDFNEDAVKRSAMRSIGAKCYEHQFLPVAVFSITEAWVSTQRGNDPVIQPRDDPNRTEAIIITGLSFDNDRCVISIPMTRNAEGNMIEAGEIYRTEDIEPRLLMEFFKGYVQQYEQKRQQPTPPGNEPNQPM